jgi:hypothetical protein
MIVFEPVTMGHIREQVVSIFCSCCVRAPAGRQTCPSPDFRRQPIVLTCILAVRVSCGPSMALRQQRLSRSRHPLSFIGLCQLLFFSQQRCWRSAS